MSKMTQEQPIEQRTTLSQKAQSNLEDLELELVSSSAYFKPEPEKRYMIKTDPENTIEKVENPKFADANGKIIPRFEFKITHVNNNADQLRTVSKTVCKQILTELDKGSRSYQ